MGKRKTKNIEAVKRAVEIVRTIKEMSLTRVTLSYNNDKEVIIELKKALKDEAIGISSFLSGQDIEIVGQNSYFVLSEKKELTSGGEVIYVDFKAKKILKKVS